VERGAAWRGVALCGADCADREVHATDEMTPTGYGGQREIDREREREREDREQNGE